jgi:hypothetical protein
VCVCGILERTCQKHTRRFPDFEMWYPYVCNSPGLAKYELKELVHLTNSHTHMATAEASGSERSTCV